MKMTSFKFKKFFKLKNLNYSYQILHLFKLDLFKKSMDLFNQLTLFFQSKLVFLIPVNLKLGQL